MSYFPQFRINLPRILLARRLLVWIASFNAYQVASYDANLFDGGVFIPLNLTYKKQKEI